jgi:hypothetical protein
MEPRTTKRKYCRTFLRQDGISHEFTEISFPQSNGLAERLNLTILDKAHSELVDFNLTPKVRTYAENHAMIVYDNLPHYALDNQKSPSHSYGDSSDFPSSTS